MGLVVEIRDLIRAANLDEWLPKVTIQGEVKRPVFAHNLPPELTDAESITTVEIEDMQTKAVAFASDRAIINQRDITIDIWYKPNADYEAFEDVLQGLMENKGFKLIASSHVSDEQTYQSETVAQYRGNVRRNNQ